MAARIVRRALLAAGAAAALSLSCMAAGAATSASTGARASSAVPPPALPVTLRIGFRENAVPFSYRLPGQDRPVGYAIELCERAIAEWHQAAGGPAPKLAYVQVDSRQRFNALKDRGIDLECANTTITRGRRQDGFVFSAGESTTLDRRMPESPMRPRGERGSIRRCKTEREPAHRPKRGDREDGWSPACWRAWPPRPAPPPARPTKTTSRRPTARAR